MDDDSKLTPDLQEVVKEAEKEELAEAYREEIEKAAAEKPPPIDLKALTDEAAAAAEELQDKATEALNVVGKQRVDVSAMADGTIRRNGPCPCGSGKKFKKCCLDDVRGGQFRRLKAFDKKVNELPDSGHEPPRSIQKKKRAEAIRNGAKRVPHLFTKLTRPGSGFVLEEWGFRKRDQTKEEDDSAD